MHTCSHYFPEDEMKKHIVFLFKENDLIYEDPFLSFPENSTVVKMIQTIKKYDDLSLLGIE